MSENLLVGSHKHTSKAYSRGYDAIIKKCGKCGLRIKIGEKCGCATLESIEHGAIVAGERNEKK